MKRDFIGIIIIEDLKATKIDNLYVSINRCSPLSSKLLKRVRCGLFGFVCVGSRGYHETSMASALKRTEYGIVKNVVFFLFFFSTYCAAYPSCDSSFRANSVDLKQGILSLQVHNPSAKTLVYSHFISCPSLKILGQAREHFTVPSKKTRTLRYILGISKSYMKKNPSDFEHKCTHTVWDKSHNSSPSTKCDVLIRTYPGGKFLLKCDSYVGKDLVIDEVSNADYNEKKIVKLLHSGKLAHYVANVSCNPILNGNTGNMYNHLKNGEIWRIHLPPNCSNVLDVDYEGTCRLSIYHMCQERSLVNHLNYPYFEGNVEQCLLKRSQSSYGGTTSQSIVDAIKALLAVLMSTIILIVITIASSKMGGFSIKEATFIVKGEIARLLGLLGYYGRKVAEKLRYCVRGCVSRLRDRGKNKKGSRQASIPLINREFSDESEEEILQ